MLTKCDNILLDSFGEKFDFTSPFKKIASKKSGGCDLYLLKSERSKKIITGCKLKNLNSIPLNIDVIEADYDAVKDQESLALVYELAFPLPILISFSSLQQNEEETLTYLAASGVAFVSISGSFDHKKLSRINKNKYLGLTLLAENPLFEYTPVL